jgi:hypothetical protein
MTINQQKLRSVVARFNAELEEYLDLYIDAPDPRIPDGAKNPEARLVLLAAENAAEVVETYFDESSLSFSFDDPPKPTKPPLRLV